MSFKSSLSMNFDALGIPSDAQAWLLDLWDIIQGFDDWYDNDRVSSSDKQVVIYKALVLLPSNPFYLQYAQYLAPVVSNAVLKWAGANTKESQGTADTKSFMWRASYYDVVLEVIRVVHGPWKALEISNHVADMYGENYEEYLKEFENA